MDYENCKRSGQIPAFGNWDSTTHLPITQYFESARQAGLIRHSSSSAEFDLYGGSASSNDADLKKPPPQTTKSRARERRGPHVKEQKKQQQQGKVCDVTEQPRRRRPNDAVPRQRRNDAAPRQRRQPPPPATRTPKAVDEDLYKIPPELLDTTKSKRKKMVGLISKCLVPTCSA